jgi:hypothetical protein
MGMGVTPMGLSHLAELAVVAFARDRMLGVDLNFIRVINRLLLACVD